jgi:hypothetical protein
MKRSWIADKEVQKQRLELCNTCDEKTALGRCKKCGCFVPIKVQIKTSSCPLKKWLRQYD